MADKQTALSIVIRTVDQSTARIQAINARLAVLTKPIKDQGKALGELREHLGLLGLDAVKSGFSAVGGAVSDLVGRFALVGGVLGGVLSAAVVGVLSLVDHFDKLGDTAERLGTSADFLAAFRFAAERAGAPVEGVDEALQSLVTNMGAAKAGTGRMLKFLNQISPTLAKQVTAANSLEEALGLLADAEAKLPDAARRAKLAQATLGDAALAPLLARGSKGVQELLTEFARLAPGMGVAAEAAGKTDDALKNLHAATEGVKASIVTGLAPALTIIIGKMTDWLVAHRADVQQWAADIGTKLPAAIDHVIVVVKDAADDVAGFVDGIGGLKVAAALAAAVVAGPLISAIASLSIALLATPVGWVILALAAVVLAIDQVVKHWEDLKEALDPFNSKSGVRGIMDQVLKIPGLQPEDKFGGGKDNSGATGIARAIPGLRDAVPVLEVPSLNVPEPAAPPPAQVSIKVDVANAPQGTRTSASSRGPATVDLNVGHQLFGGSW